MYKIETWRRYYPLPSDPLSSLYMTKLIHTYIIFIPLLKYRCLLTSIAYAGYWSMASDTRLLWQRNKFKMVMTDEEDWVMEDDF